MVLKTRSKAALAQLPEIPLSMPDIPDGAAASLVRALMSPVPRPLLKIDAELVMFSGQYLLHYKDEGGAERYKFLTPGALRSAFAAEPVDTGWLSPSVVRWGESIHGKYMAMWVPPAVTGLQVETTVSEGEGKGKRVETESVSVPLPGMLFLGIGRRYFVWAAGGPDFNPNAEAYYPPLPNVMGDGAVCWGANQPPAVSEAGGIEKAWQLFLSSPFNDHMAGSRCKSFPNDCRGLLHKLARGKGKSVPSKELMPFHRQYGTRSTIAQAVDHALKGGHE